MIRTTSLGSYEVPLVHKFINPLTPLWSPCFLAKQACLPSSENSAYLLTSCFLGQNSSQPIPLGKLPITEDPSLPERPFWFLLWEYNFTFFEILLALAFKDFFFFMTFSLALCHLDEQLWFLLAIRKPPSERQFPTNFTLPYWAYQRVLCTIDPKLVFPPLNHTAGQGEHLSYLIPGQIERSFSSWLKEFFSSFWLFIVFETST